MVIMGKTRVVFTGVVEDMEGQVWVMLAGYERYETFMGEIAWPRLDWWCDGVRLKQVPLGFDGREVVVGRVGLEGVFMLGSSTNSGKADVVGDCSNCRVEAGAGNPRRQHGLPTVQGVTNYGLSSLLTVHCNNKWALSI